MADGPTQVVMSSTGKRKRRCTQRLIVPFDPAPLLRPQFLCALDKLRQDSPLREPEVFWPRVAAKLDARMEQLRGERRLYGAAAVMLGDAPSFSAKCARFFVDARRDFAQLGRLGVSPNVIAASVVLFAWDWQIDSKSAHKLLAEGAEKWARRWRLLREARALLLRLQPVARQSDLYDEAARRATPPGTSLGLDFTDVSTEDLTDEDGVQSRAAIAAEEADLWWPHEERLLARCQQTAEQLKVITDELRQVVRHVQSGGRRPRDKINFLIAVLGSALQAHGVKPRFLYVARLLDAAALPGFKARQFSRKPENVSQLYKDFAKRHRELARQIAHEARAALDKASLS